MSTPVRASGRYVALRAMQVHVLDEAGKPTTGPDGEPVLRLAQRGELVPEVAHWERLDNWIKQGWILPEHEFVPDPVPAEARPEVTLEAEPAAETPRRKRRSEASEAASA